MAKWHFRDLHGFKDYVVFVQMCSPDQFPVREWRAPEEQFTLDLAFEGLRYGLDLAEKEKGPLPAFTTCRELVEEAYTNYRAGRTRDGYFKLDEMKKLIRQIPSE